MILSGLTSITFRQLEPNEIIKLANEANIKGIEWGGDIHVPHGNLAAAREVKAMTLAAGLNIIAYGSYYFVGHSKNEGLEFKSVVDTAKELGAEVIRIWPGKIASEKADNTYRQSLINETKEIADIAEDAGIQLAFESHLNSLTDTADSSFDFLSKINRENVKSYWQPISSISIEDNLKRLDAILPWLKNVHVFQWESDNETRHPLSDGKDEWQMYFNKIAEVEKNIYASLEFVKDDSPQQFIEDAATLKLLINEA